MVPGNRQGGVSGVHQDNADSDLSVSGNGSTQERCCLHTGYMGEGLNMGTTAAVPLDLFLNPHNSIFPSMSLAPSDTLSLCRSPG